MQVIIELTRTSQRRHLHRSRSRSVNDALGAGNHGALLKISGFKVKSHDHDFDDDDWK
jgi:hypothetical protein